MSRPRLAFVSIWDATDRNAYSGAAYSMRRELAKFFDVLDIFPLHVPEKLLLLPRRTYYQLTGAYYEIMREPVFLRALARRIGDEIQRLRPDLIFAPSSIPLSYVETDIPIFWAADLVLANYAELYVANPSSRWVKLGHAQEAAALKRATRASFPSHWAAQGAMAHYGASPDKIDVIPWGANLDHPIERQDVEAAIASRSGDACRLVFVGKDWKRKGGNLVFETTQLLNRRGLKTELTIIGCDPPIPETNGVTVHPFIDKGDPQGWATFRDVMNAAHFFFMPSRAEASPHALCEASAFGVASLSSTEGGIPTIVRDGETGFTRDKDSSPEIFADLIEQTFLDRERYGDMCRAARQDFEDRLNWPQFGRQMSERLSTAL